MLQRKEFFLFGTLSTKTELNGDSTTTLMNLVVEDVLPNV